jgi:hypothetical protein
MEVAGQKVRSWLRLSAVPSAQRSSAAASALRLDHITVYMLTTPARTPSQHSMTTRVTRVLRLNVSRPAVVVPCMQITLTAGEIGRLANGAVWAELGETVRAAQRTQAAAAAAAAAAVRPGNDPSLLCAWRSGMDARVRAAVSALRTPRHTPQDTTLRSAAAAPLLTSYCC